MSAYTDTDAENYLSAVTRCLASVRGAARSLRDGEVNDLAPNLDTLDEEIEDLIGAMPCEDGVREFAQGNHDECYSSDDVALSTYGVTDRYDVSYAGLVRQDDMAELLADISENTGSFRLRQVLALIVAELESGDFRGQTRDATDYRQEVRDHADADTTISAA